MEGKTIAFLVVGIVVGAAIGIGAGYALFNSDDSEATTYWFYIDYGVKADDSHTNGWVNASGTTIADAIKNVSGVKTSDSEKYGTSLEGINGVENDYVEAHAYWAQYVFIGNSGSSTFESGWTLSGAGLGGTYTTCMYLGYMTYDTTTYVPATPTDKAWIGTGPLEA